MLRPSIVLARNPNREGNQWPARLCDRDEVEESFAHSALGAEARVSGDGVGGRGVGCKGGEDAGGMVGVGIAGGGGGVGGGEEAL